MDLESGVTLTNLTSVKRYPNHCPFKMEKNPFGKILSMGFRPWFPSTE